LVSETVFSSALTVARAESTETLACAISAAVGLLVVVVVVSVGVVSVEAVVWRSTLEGVVAVVCVAAAADVVLLVRVADAP
jgi:hypothetical protein